MKVTLVKAKKGAAKAAMKPAKAGAALDFQLQDNQDDTCTVNGVDAAGNVVDISGVATITVVSSDPSVLTVDTPMGMTFAMHAVGPLGSSVVTVVATWNDGSVVIPPVDLPVTVVAGPAGGIQIVPGVPTIH